MPCIGRPAAVRPGKADALQGRNTALWKASSLLVDCRRKGNGNG